MNLKAFYLSSGVYVPSRTLSLISLLFDKVYMLTLDPLSADIALRRGYELSDESKAAIKEMSKTVERFLQETEPLRQEGVLAVMPFDEVKIKNSKLRRIIKLRSRYESFLPISEVKLNISDVVKEWPIFSPPESEDEIRPNGNFRDEVLVRFRYLSPLIIAQGVEAEMIADEPTPVTYLRSMIYRRRRSSSGRKNRLMAEIPELRMNRPSDLLKARGEYKAELDELREMLKGFTDEIRSKEIPSIEKAPRNLRRDLKRMAKLLRKITHKIESDPNISATIGKRKISPVMSVELFPYLSFRRFALGSSETEERNSFVLQLDFNPRR